MSNKAKYTLVVRKTRIPVPQKVYKAYYQERNREKYLERLAGRHETAMPEHPSVAAGHLALIMSGRELEDRLIAEELRSELHRALSHLTKDERDLINDLYFLGKSERSTARERGIHYMTLRQRKLRIIKKLQEFFDY